MKKGQSDWYLNMAIVRLLLVTTVILITLKVFVSMMGQAELDTSRAEAEVLHARITYSDALNHVSAQNRTYPGIIDIYKVTTENLERNIDYSSDLIAAAKITLYEENGLDIARTAYVNEARFRTWQPISSAKIRGEAAAYVSRTRPVTIKDNTTERKGFLKVEVVAP